VQVRSFDAVCRMVAAGMGITILPRSGAVPQAQALGLHLAHIDGMRTERRLLMVMRRRDALTPAARALVDMVSPQ
jgi:DNA-binding transcriptional LysR family regulator